MNKCWIGNYINFCDIHIRQMQQTDILTLLAANVRIFIINSGSFGC